MRRKSPGEIGECYGEINCVWGGKVLQSWHGSGTGNCNLQVIFNFYRASVCAILI